VRILFVDNHAEFTATVTRAFLEWHEVNFVPTIASARRALSNHRYDVALVDYDLDDGKGESLVRWARRVGHAIPIVAVSAHEDGNRALVRAGANAVCVKRHFARMLDTLAALLPAN
jgi:DNA-binding response OmpR family regulator